MLIPTNFALLPLGVMLLNRSTAWRESATNMGKNMTKHFKIVHVEPQYSMYVTFVLYDVLEHSFLYSPRYEVKRQRRILDIACSIT